MYARYKKYRLNTDYFYAQNIQILEYKEKTPFDYHYST